MSSTPISAVTRRYLLKTALRTGAVAATVGIEPLLRSSDPSIAQTQGQPIKVGILHSLTGTMAISESSVVDAELLAIKQINQAGGVLGRSIQPIIKDGASDWPMFAEQATQLIEADRVVTVFGCWTSASRKAVLPVFESRQHMLWYPIQYEGQECSRNIFYTGATPNQQIEPAVEWLVQNRGSAFFLVGSDYVFPRTAHAIIKSQLQILGGTTVGEEYLPLGDTEVASIIAQIQQRLPQGGVIFNSLNGDSNVAFFQALHQAGLTPDRYPTLSVSIAEEEVKTIGAEIMRGHYAAWNYFMTVESPENQAFVNAFQAEYGLDRVTTDPMEAAYIMVNLWKQAVEAAGTVEIEAVRRAALGQSYGAPEGEVSLQTNHHLSKFVRIGEVRQDGLFEVIFSSPEPVQPIPWNQYLEQTRGLACDWSDPTKGGKYMV